MKLTFLKKISLISLSVGALLSGQTQAANDNIEVTPIQDVTNHELAAIYVLSEICPSILKDQGNFDSGYAKLVKEYLPNQKNPVEALTEMTKLAQFKPILLEAQQDAEKAGPQKNLEICTELTTYSNS